MGTSWEKVVKLNYFSAKNFQLNFWLYYFRKKISSTKLVK